MRILTSHGHEVTLRGLCRVVPSTPQSHLACTFLPCIHIFTSHTYSHLACSPPPNKVTLHAHSYLPYIFSPRVLPSTQNNIFHLTWKNSQKSFWFTLHQCKVDVRWLSRESMSSFPLHHWKLHHAHLTCMRSDLQGCPGQVFPYTTQSYLMPTSCAHGDFWAFSPRIHARWLCTI